MRVILDSCVVFDLALEPRKLNDSVWDIIDDPENRIYVSAETIREMIVSFNNKKLLHKRWKTANDMLISIEDEYGVEVLPITRNVVATYAQLHLNLFEDHRDPSDHVIISHAMTERMTLISSDTRFPYYRDQGLDLIEY